MPIYTGSNKHLGGTETVTKRHQFFYGLVQKNVLVTGANGQLGNEIARLTKNRSLPFRFIFTDVNELDITCYDSVSDFVHQHTISIIIHCAAYTAVDKAETDADRAYEVNCKGAENIAKVAAEANCRLIHISTDYVFDGNSKTPYTEEDKPNPQSVYGRTKRQGEEAVLAANSEAIIIRTSWLYSEFGNNFVKTMIRLMHERETLNVVDDQHGSPTYAADLAEMILHILEDCEQHEWKPGIYHFSNRGATTWCGFAQKIKELYPMDLVKIEPIRTEQYPLPAKRPAFSVLNTSKIEEQFHVVIPSWQEALKRCIQQLNKQE